MSDILIIIMMASVRNLAMQTKIGSPINVFVNWGMYTTLRVSANSAHPTQPQAQIALNASAKVIKNGYLLLSLVLTAKQMLHLHLINFHVNAIMGSPIIIMMEFVKLIVD